MSCTLHQRNFALIISVLPSGRTLDLMQSVLAAVCTSFALHQLYFALDALCPTCCQYGMQLALAVGVLQQSRKR